jgi:hypothetical protein
LGRKDPKGKNVKTILRHKVKIEFRYVLQGKPLRKERLNQEKGMGRRMHAQ